MATAIRSGLSNGKTLNPSVTTSSLPFPPTAHQDHPIKMKATSKLREHDYLLSAPVPVSSSVNDKLGQDHGHDSYSSDVRQALRGTQSDQKAQAAPG